MWGGHAAEKYVGNGPAFSQEYLEPAGGHPVLRLFGAVLASQHPTGQRVVGLETGKRAQHRKVATPISMRQTWTPDERCGQ